VPRIIGKACCYFLIGGLLLAHGILLYLGSTPGPEGWGNNTYQPRKPIDTGGYSIVFKYIPAWQPDASLEEQAAAYQQAVPRGLAALDEQLEEGQSAADVLVQKAGLLHAKGDPAAAYQVLEGLESRIKGTPLETEWLYTVIFYKGVSALRMGENDNCVRCLGESACIFPIAPAAVHTNPKGSRLAIKHFGDYLRQFPDDLEVKWLLNLAHMTLGQYPDGVDPRHRLLFDAFCKSEPDIGRFRDVSLAVGLHRVNQSGGAVMEDFDNDGLLDLVVTGWAPFEPMAFYRNKGDGTFEDRSEAAGLGRQLGGLYCVQTDYNNDGYMDIFIPRGSWLPAHLTQRPSLLRNNGNGTFTDVTAEAGLLTPTNSTSATWADYDNDGFLDLFLCGRHHPSLLYHNKGNGTFEEVSARAGLADLTGVLGAAWIDFDNDGYADLFVNIDGSIGGGTARLFRNNRDGTFTDVTQEMGIDGPTNGFSCCAFDFDNDGWLDIFATTRSRALADVVRGMLGQPHGQPTARLYRNLGGKGFQDVTKEVGLDECYAPMGSNFGDLTNDGYLDIYLGTGDPQLSMLVPNRLFKNVAGKRFAEITASSRTGHLQKGHSVAIGDWDRNGTADIFIQVGGAVEGDRYHNVLFQNPGQGNNWLNVKLIGGQTKDGGGKKTNRAAIGARIKVVTAGPQPLTVYRHVSSGSSFGANPLEQHIGLGKAERVALLEIDWPASGTKQVFRDIAANQGVVITEFAEGYERRTWKAAALK
jgi:hypothetical protein